MAAPATPGASDREGRDPAAAWDEVRPAPVVLVTGPETVLAERAIRLLRDILRAEDPTLEVSDLDAGAYAPGELHHPREPVPLRRAPADPGRRRREVTDAFLDEALAYLEAPADDTYLVLRHAGGVRGKKLLDAIRGRHRRRHRDRLRRAQARQRQARLRGRRVPRPRGAGSPAARCAPSSPPSATTSPSSRRPAGS